MLPDLSLKTNEIKELNIYMYGSTDSSSKLMATYIESGQNLVLLLVLKPKKKIGDETDVIWR